MYGLKLKDFGKPMVMSEEGREYIILYLFTRYFGPQIMSFTQSDPFFFFFFFLTRFFKNDIIIMAPLFKFYKNNKIIN